jgi:hypothetical protein
MNMIQTKVVAEGPGPDELVVEIDSEGGTQVVVHGPSLDSEKRLEVGLIGFDMDDKALIELPRETVQGKWRIWVDKSAVMELA